MKILMVNKFLHPNGGSETYVFKLGKYLVLQGHEVQFFGMEHEGRIVGNHAEAYTSDMDFHKGSKLSKITYPIKTIYSTEARRQIRKVLDDFRPDVVHLNNFTYQITPSIILEIVQWRRNNQTCRIVFTAHDYNLVCPNHMLYNPNKKSICEKCLGGHYVNCLKGKCIHNSRSKSFIGMLEGYYWNYRKTYKYIDSVVCCSEFLKNKMDTNPIFKDKTIAIHNFVDDSVLNYSEKKDYVIYFGRYSQEKGIKTLIEVCKTLPNIHFIFAGIGPLENEVNGVNNITNVGFKTGVELEKLIKEAKFSIYPSEWYENCPFSVMESQMYGTPVLGADIGGIPELIVVGKTGELFEAGNSDDLEKKITEMWNNRIKLNDYSINCRNNHFDNIESYYQKIMNVYEGKK